MSIGGPNTFKRPEASGARNTQERIRLIVNPRAGAGRAVMGLDRLKRAADRAFAQWDLVVTEAPGHATVLAREAAAASIDIVAAVGGDGTCHEVINGLVRNGRAIRRKTVFTVIPAGTGGDLPRTLCIPPRISDALWIAATGITLPSDLGLATVTGPDGPVDTAFVNVAGFGANGAVVRASNQRSKRFGGRVTFLMATLEVMSRYQPTEVEVTLQTPEGERHYRGPLVSGFIANGAYCGGGMWVGKGGSMQDGLFDVTLVPPTARLRQLLDARHLFDGALHRGQGVVQHRASEVSVRPIGDGHALPVDVDGESPGDGPATFSIVPRALNIRGGWMASIGSR
jgi:YegS/Rv2252/BmrU family lipid kinase